MIEPGASSLQRRSYAIKEEHHLDEVFKKNGYPTSFIRSSSLQVPRNKETETDCDAEEKSPLVLIPYEQVKTSEE